VHSGDGGIAAIIRAIGGEVCGEFLEKAGGAALVLATAFSSAAFALAPSLIQSI